MKKRYMKLRKILFRNLWTKNNAKNILFVWKKFHTSYFGLNENKCGRNSNLFLRNIIFGIFLKLSLNNVRPDFIFLYIANLYGMVYNVCIVWLFLPYMYGRITIHDAIQYIHYKPCIFSKYSNLFLDSFLFPKKKSVKCCLK